MRTEQKDIFILLAIFTIGMFYLEPKNILLWASRFCASVGIIFVIMDAHFKQTHKMLKGVV